MSPETQSHGRSSSSRALWWLTLLTVPACVQPERDPPDRDGTNDATRPIAGALAQVPAAAMPGKAPTVIPNGPPIQQVSGSELRRRIEDSGYRATIVNAWASWCGPCRQEFPMLVKLKAQLAKRGVHLLFVSMDDESTRARAVQFAKDNGESGPLLVAEQPLGPFKQSLHPGWPGMLPATFLFDENARLRHFWGGPVYEGELMPVVQDFLQGKSVDGSSDFALIPGKDYRNSPPPEETASP